MYISKDDQNELYKYKRFLDDPFVRDKTAYERIEQVYKAKINFARGLKEHIAAISK